MAVTKVKEWSSWAGWRDPPGLVRLDPPREPRNEIGANREFLDAVIAMVHEYAQFWPLTLRQCHYRLLTRDLYRARAGLYTNTRANYNALSDLLGRARVLGELPWEALTDPTRDWTHLYAHPDLPAFVRHELELFLANYQRLLLRSQPAHIELVCEKTTAIGIIEQAVGDFTLQVGRSGGQSSVDFIHRASQRFWESGKLWMVLLLAGDLDKSGGDICDAWVRGLRDDHGLGEKLRAYRVAVTQDQVDEYGLKPAPKEEGLISTAYELEAFEPAELQDVVQTALGNVLDMSLLERERRRYRRELEELTKLRSDIHRYLARKIKA